ncbi:MAG: hypothetical protein ACUVSU_08770 [Aggregatilineaceae bacterium]
MVPVDLLDTLHEVWEAVCRTYDVSAPLPDMAALFEGADLAVPPRAAETVLTNMLTEAMECVGRFSPWYRQPVWAFGLALVHETPEARPHWSLTPHALQDWQRVLGMLAVAIERNIGLILSANVVASLDMLAVPEDDPCVMAACQCTPPRVILVNRSVLQKAEIRCDTCQELFHEVEDRPIDGAE